MKKHIYTTLTVVLLVSLLVSCGVGEPKNTMEKMKKENKIIIVTHPVNAPFEFGAGTGYDGFDYELGQAIARELKVDAHWIKRPFEKCFSALGSSPTTAEADIILSALTITPEREKSFLFSEPYLETGLIIAVHKESAATKKLEDLKGKKVGVQKDTTAEQFLRTNGFTDAEIQTYDNPEDALSELNQQMITAVVGDAPTLQYEVQRKPNLRIVGDLLTREKYGIAMRKSDVELKAAIDGILKNLKQSGEINKLIEKWKLNVPIESVGGKEIPPTKP